MNPNQSPSGTKPPAITSAQASWMTTAATAVQTSYSLNNGGGLVVSL